MTNIKTPGLLFIILAVCTCLSCSEDDYLDGFDRQLLFTNPTQEEIDNVKMDWDSRNLAPENYEVVQAVQVADNGTMLKIVSFKVGEAKEYGALLIPRSVNKIPVRMFIGGFGKDITTNSIVGSVDNNNSQKVHLSLLFQRYGANL